MATISEENYIKTIYKLEQGQPGPVLTSAIAGSLSTTAASVTDMIRKLSEKNLVEYERYKGVKMTRKGEKMALGIIRRHRLWEVFLEEKLHFRWDEVHEMADELEHVSSDELITRLEAYLGHPRFDPHGDPIPDKNGRVPVGRQELLSGMKEGHSCRICGVNDHSPAFLRFLEKKGLLPGVEICILELDEFDQSMKIAFKDNSMLFISRDISNNLLVTKPE